MSRFAAGAVRFAFALSRPFLIVASFMVVSAAQFAEAQATTAPPQLLPYTVTAVAGGGTLGATGVTSNYNPTSSPFAQGQACATGSSLTATDIFGDGCLATQVRLVIPRAAISDSEGNLFIVDSANALIRRVDAHTGIITTVAGGGTFGTTISVTGSASVIAITKNPFTVGQACAASGSLTATDAAGDGCLATQIALESPEAVAFDPQGNLWFTDYYQSAVREINRNTGIISTVVNTAMTPGYNADNVAYTASGISAANGKLYQPYGLTFDAQGNLYIADNYNNVVDVVNLSGQATIAGYRIAKGEIFTIAGSGCPSPYNTTSPFCSTKVGASYPYEGYSNGATPYQSTGSTLDAPYEVAVDGSGDIYIADEYPYDVRVINGKTGDISTFAGVLDSHMANTSFLSRGTANATALGSIYGVATDPMGNVYISMFQTPLSVVARVDVATSEVYPIAGQFDTAVPTTYPGVATPAGAVPCSAKTDVFGDGCPGLQATFWRPYQPSVDAAGNLYVADQDNYLIRKISVGTQFPATSIGASVAQTIEVHFGEGDGPAASAYALPSGFTDFTITPTGSCTTNTDTTKDCLLSVTFSPTTAGIRTAPLTVTGTSGLASSFSLTGTGLAPVLAVDPGTQSTLASANLTAVNNIALDNGGNIYAAVKSSSSILKISPGTPGTESTIGSGLTDANAVAIDAAGNIYAALSSGSVVKVLANGTTASTVGNGFTTPSGLAVDSYGNIFVSDSSANSVSEILATTGAQVVLASSNSNLQPVFTVSDLNLPSGLAVDGYGNVFVANTGGNSIIELPFAPGSACVTLGSGLDAPTGVAVDPAGSLYIADGKNSRVVFIPNENGTLTTADQFAMITNEQLVTPLGIPSGVAVAGNGTVYISDSQNNAIYSFARNTASFDFGGVATDSGTFPSVPVDIISMGTENAAFGSNFVTPGSASGYFSLSAYSIPNSSDFPNAGYGLSMTATFSPLIASSTPFSAAYTFGNITPTTQPILSLSGTGQSIGNDASTPVLSAPPPTGQSEWTYGQTVDLLITESASSGLPAATGTVTVEVGTATYKVQLSGGSGSLSLPGLTTGPNTITANYSGDSNFAVSTGSLQLTVAPAPLTVTVNNVNKNFDAPMPSGYTSTLSGIENGDEIAVTYSTTATAASPNVVGGYPINATVSGSALANYSVTVVPGTLTIEPDATVVAVGASATSVNPTTPVTLTATVSNQNAYPGETPPAGTVTFFNTVGSTTTLIGATPVVGGVATYNNATFATSGQTTNNSITAVYSDTADANFLSSNSNLTPVVIQSGTPTVALAASTTNSSLTVAPGQSGLTSFNLVPQFGYNGTITFSCSATSPSISCSFSPSTIVANGTSTSYLVALTISTQPPASQASNHTPAGTAGSDRLPLSLATLPALALLCGFSGMRRRFLRSSRSLMLLALCLLAIGFSGCGGNASVAGTPQGAQTVTVVATGTGGSFANVTQQFTVTLNVQ